MEEMDFWGINNGVNRSPLFFQPRQSDFLTTGSGNSWIAMNAKEEN